MGIKKMENDLKIIQQNEQLLLAYGRFFRNVNEHKNVMVSVSGGADSDIMIDMLLRFSHIYGIDNSIFHFVFFDTGIEYEATKKHLLYLQTKYNIEIEKIKAIVPVPLGCKKYGVPFFSKRVSQMIGGLQKHNFDFKNDTMKDYEYLSKKYFSAKSYIGWLTANDSKNANDKRFNCDPIMREYLYKFPPQFNISDKCCNGAKKNTGDNYAKTNKIDLRCLGLRKAEGGIRSTAYQTCFSSANDKCNFDNYRPIWFFGDKDKEFYKTNFDIKHSDCYEVWGFKRTGCAGCPFNSRFEEVLLQVKKYEPMLYNACNHIFGESYEYTRAYRKFKEEIKAKKNYAVK